MCMNGHLEVVSAKERPPVARLSHIHADACKLKGYKTRFYKQVGCNTTADLCSFGTVWMVPLKASRKGHRVCVVCVFRVGGRREQGADGLYNACCTQISKW